MQARLFAPLRDLRSRAPEQRLRNAVASTMRRKRCPLSTQVRGAAFGHALVFIFMRLARMGIDMSAVYPGSGRTDVRSVRQLKDVAP